MKHLSLKMKLTLLYTILMSAVVIGILTLLFSGSSKQILASVQTRLRNEVFNAKEDINSDDGELEFDKDLADLSTGVYLSVYAANGKFLYGRIPKNFSNHVAFSDGAVRSVKEDGSVYYIMDNYAQIENYGNVYIRGISLANDAEQNILIIRNLALILMPLAVLMAAVLGYFMIKRTLRPVSRMTETVRKICKDNDLSKRIGLGRGRDEIYRLAQTFDDLLAQVEAGLKRERQFTSDVSHELRTPIYAMQLQCEELLAEKQLDEQTRQKIEFLNQKIKYLTQMISQLLLLSRADQGRQKLNMEKINFSELTEMAVMEAKEMAAEKNITVSAEIDPDIYIWGDETLLIRLWINLLENAVRYGKENGRADIRLRLEGGTICGSITDDGIGIGKEDLPHIWERFYQADASRSSNNSSGLGLSMVLWIVKAHGGTIRAESELGHGSRFSFEFKTC